MSSSPLTGKVSDPRSTLLPFSSSTSSPSAPRAPSDIELEKGAIHYNTALSLGAATSLRRSYFLNQMLAICGGCNAADAVEVLAVSFILPNATDDLNLTGLEKGWLAGMIFFGMMLGGWIWGSLSDRYGRRRCLTWCLLINAIGGLLSAFAPNFGLILLCRFASGVGVGGSVPVVFTYFSEFLCTRDRGPYMVLIACCWMVGSLFTAGLAWIIIPRTINIHMVFLEFHSWRLFAFLCAFPSLACAVALLSAPESPRFLLSQGRRLEAKEVLIRLYELNYGEQLVNLDDVSPAGSALYSREGKADPGTWTNSLCGLCCHRRIRHSRARNFLLSQTMPSAAGNSSSSSSSGITRNELLHARSNSGAGMDSAAPGVAAGGGTSPSGLGLSSLVTSNSSSKIKYDSLPTSSSSVGLGSLTPSPSGLLGSTDTSTIVLAGNAHALASPQERFHAPHSDNPDDAVASAFTDAQLLQLDETTRWDLFVTQLKRLDLMPVNLEEHLGHGVGAEPSHQPLTDVDASPSSISPESHTDQPPHHSDDVHLMAQEDGSGSHLDSSLGSNAARYDGCWGRFLATMREYGANLRVVVIKTLSLFHGESRTTSIRLLIVWFMLAFGYYGLTMWMPSYFSQKEGNDQAGGSDGGGTNTDGDDGNMDVYLTAVIGALSALPANIVSIYTVRSIGRIKTLVISLLLSGVCVLLVPAVGNSSAASVTLLSVFSGVNTAAWNAINISTTELYPTSVRATAFGFFAAMGRIGAILGNLMFGEFMSGSAVAPLVITGVSLLIAAIFGALLPETKHLNLT